MTEQISPAEAVAAAKAAGLDASSLEAQIDQDADQDAGDRLAALEQRLAAVEQQPTDPEAAERKLAEDYRDALNQSLSPWIDVGGS